MRDFFFFYVYHKSTLGGARTNDMGLFYIDYTEQEDCFLRGEDIFKQRNYVTLTTVLGLV